ncbi:NAD(P)-binding protein [Trametes elegans]|nr:NAD(P)-binding protein [Trametes elegans]
MPSITAPAQVLVTGANGYIGLWVIRYLLDGGYRVRAAVRSSEKGESLIQLFSQKLPEGAHHLTFVVVPDLSAENAFDKAVHGISGIVHIASPMTLAIENPSEIIGPAVNGTINLLRSATTHGTDVRRIVLTSSIKAVVGDQAKVYTESDWNDHAVKQVETKGKDANKTDIYAASKTLAERAAWKYYEEHRSHLSWDLSVNNAGWIYGPTVDDPPSPAKLPSTMGLFYHQLFHVRDPAQIYPKAMNFVDVRDVALLHVRALEVDQAGNERIIASSEWCTWKHWLDAAQTLGLVPGLDKGDPTNYPIPPEEARRICSNQKAKRILGVRFRTLSETLKDILDDFHARGWLEAYES